MNGNDFMAWVLRSPFHGMLSGGMLLVTVTGRKTGKAYTLPVEYVQEGRLHTDPSVVQSRLAAYLLHMPMSAKALGVRMENKIPNPEDLARVASDLVFIQIELLK
jgi:hypothetical protein